MTTDFGSIKERIAAFDAEHGASVYIDGWVLFQDGALRESSPYGVLKSPPADRWECAKRKLNYRHQILQRAIQEFDRVRNSFLQVAKTGLQQKFCPSLRVDPAEARKQLKALQATVLAAQKDFDAVESECEATKPARLKQREAQNEINRKANEALLSSLDGIEV